MYPMIGFGLLVGLRDAFSKQAYQVAASARTMDQSVGAAAIGIRRNVGLMMGGLTAAGVGLFAWRAMNRIAKEGTADFSAYKELLIKGFAPEDYERIKRQGSLLVAAYGQPVEQSGKAFVRLAEYNIRAINDQLFAMTVASRTAAGTSTELVPTTDILLELMRDLDYELRQLPELSGKVQIGADETRVSFQEMGQALLELKGPMTMYDIGLEKMMGYMLALKKGMGLSPGAASGALNFLMESLTAPTEQGIEKMRQMGGEAIVAAIKAKDLGLAIDLLGARLAQMDPSKYSEFLEAFASRPKAKEALLAIAKYRSEIGALESHMASGALARYETAAKVRLDSYGTQLQINSALHGRLKDRIGELIAKAHAPLLTSYNNLLVKLNEMVDSNEWWLGSILGTVRGLTKLATFAGIAAAAIGLIRQALVRTGTAAAATAGQVAVLKMGLSSLWKASGPLLLIMLAIWAVAEGLSLAWRHNFLGIHDFASKVWERVHFVMSAINEMILGLKGDWTEVSVDVKRRLEDMGLWEFAVKIVMIYRRLQSLWEGFTTGFAFFMEGMKMVFAEMWELVRPLFDLLKRLGIDIFGSVEAWRVVGIVVGLVVGGIVALLGILIGAIGLVAAAITGIAVGALYVWASIWSWLGEVSVGIVDKVRSAVVWIGSSIKNVFTTALDWVTRRIEQFKADHPWLWSMLSRGAAIAGSIFGGPMPAYAGMPTMGPGPAAAPVTVIPSRMSDPVVISPVKIAGGAGLSDEALLQEIRALRGDVGDLSRQPIVVQSRLTMDSRAVGEGVERFRRDEAVQGGDVR